MKKLLAITLVAAMTLSLAACSKNEETPGDGEPLYHVGVVQQLEHPALDAATKGFSDALTEELGDLVKIEVKNASGESANLPSIVDGYVTDEVDLIMANATGALQAAASATSTIPVLGTSVTDYATALDIENWTGTVGNNISGTSDLAPLDQQAEMLHELYPDAQTVGILYCSAEPNSEYQCRIITEYLEGYGYKVEKHSFSKTEEITDITTKACESCDVIYIPTDNTAANAAETIANVVEVEKVPVIAGEEGICSGCGVATLSISYYDLGYATGKMAAKVLTGEADVSTMPVEYASEVTKEYDEARCELMGLVIPEGYTAIVKE